MYTTHASDGRGSGGGGGMTARIGWRRGRSDRRAQSHSRGMERRQAGRQAGGHPLTYLVLNVLLDSAQAVADSERATVLHANHYSPIFAGE